MAIFQWFGYIPVRIDFENIEVREGATILAAIFNNVLGIISRPVDRWIAGSLDRWIAGSLDR